MTFDAILAQVLDLLQRQGRVSYRAGKKGEIYGSRCQKAPAKTRQESR
jgi:hypothetical protein